VNVSAKDKATGKENSVAITSSGGLSDAQVEQMVRDAESHAGEDKKRKEMIDGRNEADTLLYSADKNIQEHGANLPQEIKDEIQNAQMNLRTAMEGDKIDELKEKVSELQKAVMKIGEALNKAKGNDAQSSEGTTTDGEATEDEKKTDAK
jgi:molecular chaperone DnaK